MEEEEEKEGLRTVECLRGRLLAERQVSRFVKDEADLITRKVSFTKYKYNSCLLNSLFLFIFQDLVFDQGPRKEPILVT